MVEVKVKSARSNEAGDARAGMRRERGWAARSRLRDVCIGGWRKPRGAWYETARSPVRCVWKDELLDPGRYHRGFRYNHAGPNRSKFTDSVIDPHLKWAEVKRQLEHGSLVTPGHLSDLPLEWRRLREDLPPSNFSAAQSICAVAPHRANVQPVRQAAAARGPMAPAHAPDDPALQGINVHQDITTCIADIIPQACVYEFTTKRYSPHHPAYTLVMFASAEIADWIVDAWAAADRGTYADIFAVHPNA
ncbi:hypothetical protein B0H13DRAFT_1889347 [Mycena leptocephala]|nr:hypothetical protein B0H13DRAFT_1889347 [Mycena leptocephala]